MGSRTAIASATKRIRDHENLEKSDEFAGSNLTGYSFVGARMRGVNLARTRGSADFRLADLTGADLTGADTKGWRLTGAKMNGVCLKSAKIDFSTALEAVELQDAAYKDTEIAVNGYRSRGIILSGFNPAEIRNAYDNNWYVGHLILSVSAGDRELDDVAYFVMASSCAKLRYPLCWEGFAQFVRERFEHRRDDLLSICRANPAWQMEERWEFAEFVLDEKPKTVEDWERIRSHRYGSQFSALIDRRIAEVKRR